MSATNYYIDAISPEQSIAEHTFAYIIQGTMHLYDGSKNYTLKSGECGFARKNCFARFKKEKENNELEKVFIFFDEIFLRRFQEKHGIKAQTGNSSDTILYIHKNDLIPNFIQSLLPYYNHGKIQETFSDLKREELLLILLKNQPELIPILFDFGIPEKVNLEEFMNRNYAFNVSIQRFAYLTGRSLSAFKRDFHLIFNQTPSRWLVQKRLEEAHFLISKSHKKPSDIYLDLGFEDLSHFSFAFKKLFGLTPSELSQTNNAASLGKDCTGGV